jgi:hypothetical protein
MEVAAFRHFNRHLASPVMEFDQKVNFESKKEDNYLMVEAHNIFMDIDVLGRFVLILAWVNLRNLYLKSIILRWKLIIFWKALAIQLFVL